MKKIIKTAMVIAGAAMTCHASAADGITVDHLGVNNTLVRVGADNAARYILLPVQEANDDATVNVLVDGKLDRVIYVRLAKSKVDYKVPFDISSYKGHDVVLNIVSSQNRANVREAKDDACWSAISLSDTFDTTNTEKYRPAYHHTSLYGWMNDPNGMFYKDGVWHLYYQWNPYGSKWQNMTWGHSTSTDLVYWEHHPAAIEPDGLGSIFSGSCAIDHTGSAEGSISYNPNTGELIADFSRLTRLVNDGGVYNGIYRCSLPEFQRSGAELKLNVFIDHSIVDIFINDRWATSIRVFPTDADASGITAYSTGNVKVKEMHAWTLSKTGSSGAVSDITADDASDAAVDVYNLQGIAVRNSVARAEATEGLPRGIYIVGGRKVIVK